MAIKKAAKKPTKKSASKGRTVSVDQGSINRLVEAIDSIGDLIPTSAEAAPIQFPSQPGVPGALPLDQVVDASMGRILGARPGSDPQRVLDLLTGAFEKKQQGEATYYTWRQRGAAPVDGSVNGQIAGAQATLYQEVIEIQTSASRLLDAVEPIILDPDDEEITETKDRIRLSLSEIASEFGRAGGAVLDRIATLKDTVDADLAELEQKLGLDQGNADPKKVLDVAQEEQIRTNFSTLTSYIGAPSLLQQAIVTLQTANNSKGTVLSRLLRTIDAIPDTVQVLYSVMDSVRFGAVDRRITPLDKNNPNDPTTFEQLFSWIETSASNDWPMTLVGGGAKRPEVIAVKVAAEKQRNKIIKLLDDPNFAKLIGTGASRVIVILEELRRELDSVAELSSGIADLPFIKEVDPKSGTYSSTVPRSVKIRGFNFGDTKVSNEGNGFAGIKVVFSSSATANKTGFTDLSSGLQQLTVELPAQQAVNPSAPEPPFKGRVEVTVANNKVSDTLADGFTYK
jgi:predicted DNA-binding protein YlxM (UPF0122 family)